MPNRILKESICRSDSIDSLSWFEEVLFYRLIVVCDDYGRYDGRIPIIKGSCFPLKSITDKDLEKSLNKLSAVGLVALYTVDGKPYLQLVAWEKHQTVRAKKSKYPQPVTCEKEIQTPENICMQMNVNVPVIQSNPNPIRNSDSEIRAERFPEFAAAYPKNGADCPGVGVEYINVLKMGITEEDLVQSAVNYAEDCKINETDDKYIKLPENFLRKLTFDKYIPGKYKRPTPPKKSKTEQYNQFMHTDYDYDELEKNLLRGDEDG